MRNQIKKPNTMHELAQKLDISRFKVRLKEAMGSESNNSFASRCGLSEATIRKYLTGKSYPTLDSLFALSSACGKSISWLATGQDSNEMDALDMGDNYISVPDMTFYMLPEASKLNEENKIGKFYLTKQWISKEGLTDRKLAIAHMIGDSMESTIRDGDVALVNIKEDGWQGTLDGLFVIFCNNFFQIKRLQFDIIKNGFHIISDNPAYKTSFVELGCHDDFKIIAKVERILTKK